MVAAEIVGSWSVELKPSGPSQLQPVASPPVSVNSMSAPAQIGLVTTPAVAVGVALTVTFTVEVFVQLFTSVTVTV